MREFVDMLNRKSEQGAKYKVVFLLRHGYSLHNYIERGVKVKKDDWRVSYTSIQI